MIQSRFRPVKHRLNLSFVKFSHMGAPKRPEKVLQQPFINSLSFPNSLYYLLTIASFRIGVPSILFNKKNSNLNQNTISDRKKILVSLHVSYELFIPFSFFVGFGWQSYECFFTFFKSLAFLALETETIVKKLTKPKSPKTKNEITKICNEPGTRCEYFHGKVCQEKS